LITARVLQCWWSVAISSLMVPCLDRVLLKQINFLIACGLLQVEVGRFLSHQIKRLEVF
jgi:hypothetical protein